MSLSVRLVEQARAASKRHPWVAAFTGFMALAAIIAVLFPSTGALLGQPLVPLASLVAGATGLREARHLPTPQRTPWTLISLGFLSASVGAAAFVILSLFGEVGAFGAMDLPLIAAYGAVMTGLLSQPHITESTSHRLRVLIDGAIGAVSVATVLWIWFVGDLFASLGTAPNWHRLAGFAYPILDFLGIVVVMIIFLRKSSNRFDPRLLLVALGFMAQVGADLSYLRSGLGRSFEEVEPQYGWFLVAFFFFLSASLITSDVPTRREYAERTRMAWLPMVAPYGWSLVMVAWLITQASSGALTTDVQHLLFATLFVGGLVVFRQFAAIFENRQHVERERRALVSTISHELRTPLTAMVGFLELITGDEDVLPSPEERDELIDVVNQQARYLSRIVSDLVLLARGTSAKMELDIHDVHLRDVIERAAAATDTGMNEVRVDIPPELTVRVDPDRIQQALVNLLSNAVRYGGDTRMIVGHTDGAELSLEVHDGGPGVPKRYELAIWERFERGANRLNATVPGSGVGLAIVAAIARAHGGSTGYRQSELMGGACFTVTIPDAVVSGGSSAADPSDERLAETVIEARSE